MACLRSPENITDKEAKPLVENLNISLELDSILKNPDFIAHFSLLNLNNGQYSIYNDTIFQKEFPPASTFKIFNSLVAIETGAISDTHQILPWDGINRGWDKWNKDQTIGSAVQYSCLWFFQNIALKVNEIDSLAYPNYLKETEYGNQKMGKDVQSFWFDNSLKINPKQQLEFLQKLYTKRLAFSSETILITKQLLKIKEYGNDILYGKTGLARMGENNFIGWYVGFIEKGDNVFFYCLNLQNRKEIKSISEFRKTYINLTMSVFDHLNLLEI